MLERKRKEKPFFQTLLVIFISPPKVSCKKERKEKRQHEINATRFAVDRYVRL